MDNDTFIKTEARRINEHFKAKETAAYLRGYTEGQEQQIRLNALNAATSLGLYYTTTGHYDDTPRELPESDAPLYTTPREVWEMEWLKTWLEMSESVGFGITQDEHRRVGYLIADMARKNVHGRIKFTYGRGIYVYEVVEVELFMRPTRAV